MENGRWVAFRFNKNQLVGLFHRKNHGQNNVTVRARFFSVSPTDEKGKTNPYSQHLLGWLLEDLRKWINWTFTGGPVMRRLSFLWSPSSQIAFLYVQENHWSWFQMCPFKILLNKRHLHIKDSVFSWTHRDLGSWCLLLDHQPTWQFLRWWVHVTRTQRLDRWPTQRLGNKARSRRRNHLEVFVHLTWQRLKIENPPVHQLPCFDTPCHGCHGSDPEVKEYCRCL